MMRLGVPWWTYDAIEGLQAWFDQRTRPMRAFEFGTGASSAWLAARCDTVDTVEHVQAFLAIVEPTLAGLGNVTMHLREPVCTTKPVVTSGRPGHDGLDFAAYVNTIADVGGEFDVIVIDGRARAQCLTAALPHLAADGVVVFDNSRRRRYRAAIDACPLVETRTRGLTPTLPYPEQTSLLRHR